MKKIFLTFIVLMVLSAFAFANGGGEKDSGQGDSADVALVALVTDVGGIDDKSFNQGTWQGVERYIQENNLSKSAYTYLQSDSDADYIPNLSTLSDEGYKLIIAPGFLFVDALSEVSNNYPDTHYLAIDTVVEDRTNVTSATFAEEQGSFLVGVAAAMTANAQGYTNVGFIGGMDFPVIQRFEAGFEEGVAAIDPNLNIAPSEYAGSFSDPQKGQTIAAKLFDQGVSIIFVAAGSTGNGVIKEAKDRVAQGESVWVIGVDRDQYEEGIYDQASGKSVILTSMMKRVDVAAYTAIDMEVKGQFKGGLLRFDVTNDGVGIPEKNPNLEQSVVNEVNAMKNKIANGEITVSELPKRLK